MERQIEGRPSPNIRSLDESLVPALIALDRLHFPAKRKAFLGDWLTPPRVAKALLQDGEIRGYAVLRQCHEGCKIGPLFAGDASGAMVLLDACAAHAVGQAIHIDVPAGQAEFGAVLANRGFVRGFQTTRMYRGPTPSFSLGSVFGVTSLELG